MHSKTPKENCSLHDKKDAEQSGLRAVQCQIREEGWFSLQLGKKNNTRNNLSVLKRDVCNFYVSKKTEVGWEPPQILSYQSNLHKRKAH